MQTDWKVKLMKAPLYKEIYHFICEQIQSGILNTGDRIPSEQELALQFNVSRITSKRALDILAEQGVILRLQGKGSFVQSPHKLGIRPIGCHQRNPAAERKQKLLGLIVPDISDTFGMDLFVGFEGACSRQNINFMFRRSYGSLELENEAIASMLAAGVDGIGIMPLHGESYSPAILQLLLEKFPVVIIDRCYPGVSSCFIGTDNLESSKTATRYLLKNGHRNIAFLSPPVQSNSALDGRIQGMTLAYEEMGLRPDRSLWFDQISSTLPQKNKSETIEANVHILKEHFKNNPQITAVFAAEYNVALIAKKALEGLSLKIPQDVSILCFDFPSRLDNDYEFTHIKQNEVYIAEYAVDRLCHFQAHNACSFFLIPGKLRIGRSTKAIALENH